ncbi:MAG TPA: PAS domain-containing protein, partial [Desulfotignum sp.]|nr:PAS domain-containing protein [Desulfotignum sp.]
MNRINLAKDHETLDQELIKRKTDLQRTQEKLRLLKKNFARAFTACPAALAITRRSDGKFLEINMVYTQILGYEPHELLGRTSTDMNIYVNPEERNMLMQQLQDQGCVRDYELQVRNKSGDIRTLLVSMEPIAYDKEPTLIWAFVDLTEKNQVAAALRKSKERMAFAFETSGIGTWELDLTDRSAPHRSLRHDQIFGYEALLSEWTYEIFLEHVHPEDRSHVDNIFNAAIDACE